jgi:HAD superfamily hydrolase (TIGR01509 family)
MVSAVIFDIDGTLVDSVDLHAEAWRQAMQRFGRGVPFERVRRQIGKGADQLLPVFFTAEGLRSIGEELKAYRAELYRQEFLPRVRPFPGVPALFRRLREDGRRIVLASSARREEVDALIDVAGVRGLFEAATSADDVERSKPHPDVFEAALDRLGAVDLREVVAVGDTPYDAEAAGKLGVATIGLLSGGWSEMDLVEAGCIEIYRDPADLLARYESSMLSPVRRKGAPQLRLAS